MRKYLIFFVSVIFFSLNSFCQSLDSFSVQSPLTLAKNDHTLGFYDSIRHRFFLICQTKKAITRLWFDSSFQLQSHYSISTDSLTIHWSKKKKAGLMGPFITQNGYYEVYNDGQRLLLIKPDYGQQKDSIVYTFNLSDSAKTKQVISIIPNKEALQVLTWTKKERKFQLYQIKPDQPLQTMEWILPATIFGTEDLSRFRKDVLKEMDIQFNKVDISYLFPVQTSQSHLIEPKYSASIYYNSDDIYIPFIMNAHSGYCLMRLNISAGKLYFRNFFLNDFLANSKAQIGYDFKGLQSCIVDSIFLVKNSSDHYFAYHFYNVNSGELIKEFKSYPKNGLADLIHSNYNQFGTWLSPKQEKELNNPKSFLRKLNGSSIYVSAKSTDSITFTNINYKYTLGIEGTLLLLSSSMVGAAANIHIGNLQIVPSLYTDRDKMIYAHSRFSLSNLTPSVTENCTTVLDWLLNNVNLRDISSNSSFFIKNKQWYWLGILDPETQKYTITKIHE